MRRPSLRPLHLLLALGLTASVAATEPATGPSTDGIGSDNMAHVANVQWDSTRRADAGRTIDVQGGTDVEFLTIPGTDGTERDYAFAGTYNNGLQVVDITDPENPFHVTTYDCEILQGDVQAFERDGRFYVTYTADDGYSHQETACHTDARADIGNGTFIIDVTDPANPEAISFAVIPGGSHNMTVHPSGLWMYNSSSDGGGNVHVVSLADLEKPEIVTVLDTAREDAHDITFNAEGTRAYAATTDATVIVNTEDPANPTVVSVIDDPAVTLHHQSDPITFDNGSTFVVINDELAGAGGNEVCPGGGLHVWDITDELNPLKVGAWFASDVTVRDGADTGLGGTVTCTSHVFRIYPEQGIMTIAWFGAGVRIIDLSGLASGGPVAGAGAAGFYAGTSAMVEVGYYRFPEDSDAWSAKAYGFDEDGSFFVYADDQTRGFDVYRFNRGGGVSETPGLFVSPDEALGRKLNLLSTGFVPRLTPVCDLSSI